MKSEYIKYMNISNENSHFKLVTGYGKYTWFGHLKKNFDETKNIDISHWSHW